MLMEHYAHNLFLGTERFPIDPTRVQHPWQQAMPHVHHATPGAAGHSCPVGFKAFCVLCVTVKSPNYKGGLELAVAFS